jgi:hypothetical protein
VVLGLRVQKKIELGWMEADLGVQVMHFLCDSGNSSGSLFYQAGVIPWINEQLTEFCIRTWQCGQTLIILGIGFSFCYSLFLNQIEKLKLMVKITTW